MVEELKRFLKRNSIIFKIVGLIVFIALLTANNGNEEEQRSYNINKANFIIELHEEGKATITEQWEVFYEGEYFRFYKENYFKQLPENERYVYEYLSSKINGKELSLIEKESDYGFLKSETDKGYQFEWFYKAKDEVVNYEVSYNLLNVIKKTSDGKTFFINRLVGEEFNKRIDEVSIKIIGENVQKINIKSLSDKEDFKIKYNNESIEIVSEKGHSGLLKINLELNSADFNAVLIENQNAEEKEGPNGFVILLILFVFLILVLALIIGIIFIKLAIDNYRMKKKFEKNPDYLKECLSLIEKSSNTILIKYTFENFEDQNFNALLILFLLSLRQKDIIVFEEDKFILKENYNNLLLIEEAIVLDDILSIIGFYNKNNDIVIKMNNLAEIILKIDHNHEEKKAKLKKSLIYLLSYYKNNILNYKLQEACKFVKWFRDNYLYQGRINNNVTSKYFKEGLSFEDLVIYSCTPYNIDTEDPNYKFILSSYDLLLFDFNDDNYRNLFFNNIDREIEREIKEQGLSKPSSSSSSSSYYCSCSSCSGCGGGGAD